MSNRLDVALNISLIVAALAVTGNAGLKLAAYVTSRPPRQPTPAGISTVTPKVGDTLPQITGRDYGAADRTFLIFLRSTCSTCSESMSFYRRLAAATAQVGRSQVLVITKEREPDLSAYLQRHDVPLLDIVATSQPLGVRGTPTLIVVDKQGQIRWAKGGSLTSNEEELLLRLASGAAYPR